MEPVPGHVPHAGVVIPIRGFRTGKARLAAVLSEPARAALAESMADRVVAAAGRLPLVVVTSAAEVHDWAAHHGLDVVADPGRGLDAAAQAGFDHHRTGGRGRVVVAHADLPDARPGALEWFDRWEPDIVTIVPCHRDDGTPVLSVPTHADFPFAYGPGSSRRHVQAARRSGLTVRVKRDPSLAFDVDIPEDLTSS